MLLKDLDIRISEAHHVSRSGQVVRSFRMVSEPVLVYAAAVQDAGRRFRAGRWVRRCIPLKLLDRI